MTDMPKSKFGISLEKEIRSGLLDEPNEILLGKQDANATAAKLEEVKVSINNSAEQPEINSSTQPVITGVLLKKPAARTAMAMAFSLLAALVVVSGGFYGFYRLNKPEVQTIQPRSQVAGAATNEVVAKVSKHLDLPQNETPNLFQVEDPQAARTEYPEAYRDIQKGDILLLYSNQAILYRPSQDKIVSVIAN